MQYLSDDVLVTGGSQTTFSYRTIFTSLPVADMTWMGVVLFASGVAKSGFEMLVVGFAHSESLPSAKSLVQPGFFFCFKICQFRLGTACLRHFISWSHAFVPKPCLP